MTGVCVAGRLFWSWIAALIDVSKAIFGRGRR